MERMIVVVFENELKAFEGSRILRQLDSEGEITVHDAQIVAREPSGRIRMVDNADMLGFPLVVGGTTVGALVGLLGGPVGVLIGAGSGALIGTIADVEETGVTDEFVSDVSKVLMPGKFAVVADIEEDWVTPLDTRMEQIGGVVFRRTRSLVKTTQDDRDAAAHRADMEQLKAERAKARSERLAKIDAKIDHLRKKMEDAIERKRVKMQLHQQQRDAKIKALQAKAAQSQGEIRRRQEAQIAELRREYAEKELVK